MQERYAYIYCWPIIHIEGCLVFPNVEVRVCQFHVMDAIQRWLNVSHSSLVEHDGKKGKTKSKKTFQVPKEAHADIARAFRFTQRCRQSDDWPTYVHAFDSAIKGICQQHGVPEQASTITSYFQDNFWCRDWRGGPEHLCAFKGC